MIDIDGVLIRFIDITSLITNKKASARLQDLADVEALEAILAKQKT
jgi:hypothetical protein